MTDQFWFWKLNISDKIMVILFLSVVIFVLDFFFKLDVEDKTKLLKQEMLQICSTKKHCKKTVNTYFQKCFDNNFDENGVGLNTSFDEEGFTECMNKNAGFEYFYPIWLSDL